VIEETIVSKYKNDFVILYLGDTALRRGLQTAIEAMTILKEKIKNCKLVIVGNSTTDSVLKQQVENLKLGDAVDFQGWQNVKLFPSYIQASAICISPLLRNVQHDVAYANKVFQYMSFAKPVLVSNAIAQKNLIEKTKAGLVHLENNPTDFAEKALELYNNEQLQIQLGKNGQQFIENEFCWEMTSEKLIELYRNLAE
jgi:glycosyltransferase involved in cell wall biosynthesis